MNKITLFKSIKLITSTITVFSLALFLTSCGSGYCGDNKAPLNIEFQVDYVGVIPVVNGNATTSKFYVHNLGDIDFSNIKYGLANAEQDSESGVDVIDNHGFTLHNASLVGCSDLAAHSSCAIEFTTPTLSLSNQNNSLLEIEVTDANGFSHVFEQVLNYTYYSASLMSSVDFTGTANLVTNLGNKRYFTAYLVGGSLSPVIYKNVSLQFDNPSILSINQGFVNGQEIGAGEVVAVELEVSPNSNVITPVNVTPIFEVEPVTSQQNKIASVPVPQIGQGLFVNTSTNIDSALSIKLGSIPMLKIGDVATIYISSFGSVNNIVINPDNSNISVVNNLCTDGVESNGSCRFDLIANGDAVGNTLVNFSMPDFGDEVFEQEVNFGPGVLPPDTVQILSNNPASTVALTPNQQSGEINYVFSNTGNSPLTNLVLNPVGGSGAELRIISNSCGDTIAVGAQCVVRVIVVSTGSSGVGAAYLDVSGTSEGNVPYNTRSSVINYTVTSGGGLLFFSSPAGASTTMVVTGNEVDSMTSNFVIQNSGSNTQSINSVALVGVNVPASLTTSNNCNGSLAGGQSCTVSVTYGPMLLESNINGVANLVVNYAESITIQGVVNYTGLGLDSSLSITNVTVSGFESGSGIESNPYHALGCVDGIPSITITYQNMSLNYEAQNLSLNLANNTMSPYMTVNQELTTCGYGSNVSNLAVAESCNLVLNVNKAQMTNASEYVLNLTYPKASWNTTQGFVSQDNFLYESSNGIYANYVQPAMTSTMNPSSGSSLNRSLIQTLTNASGCGDISSTISSLSDFGVSASPTVTTGNCVVNEDKSLSCTNSSSSSSNQIDYVIPNDLALPASMFLEFGTPNNSQMWFNPSILVFNVSLGPQ